ncbi:hypothetical protein D6C84_01904 [Aureobasidium pullulans]|uniref:Uncharacterized protein n=1 Tax=Aureobasidium pullulans TaxID=5580 RepID=A0A4S9Y2T3_AURPU|nr:hypothetical protein D6C84_01904 [Aureobasidium pullulans]
MLNWYLLNVIDLFEENGDRVALADGQKAMLHIFARLRKIRIKSEWKRSKRIRKMDEEEMSTSMEEWLTARLRPGEPGSILTASAASSTRSSPSSMSSFHTIYIFCIFTFCVIECEIQVDDHNAELKEHYKKKYGGFLGLPMTLAYHDPLRFEFAHREHGEPTWSRFPEECTSSPEIDDRGNSMLMETCTSNYTKRSFSVEICDAVKKEIRECRMEEASYFSRDGLGVLKTTVGMPFGE